ncbi:hypothetical protein [Pseudomonas gingeri]|uniref:Uncharacterized protein n=1 Tax=Pseudomonas gingeri TaxID=117681 RepID=A0A7Y7YAS3_9PSED|nr:hypothetical protein [Pseudomonas gingeri]NWA02144.1 hypothetical protein [Pseudomonas gingeri]NWA12962.1 hypothetical protein [Pseudomonas gingeri]NWA57704.1 hypothetical protein [Pseudomonas gingeri]NWA93333.1 hypothetical protein [Pseudomonas gingeri]NWB02683.1 hypothetical protein [Pseudomonas gingeri]
MKTFTPALRVSPASPHPQRDLPRARIPVLILSIFKLLCVERKGAVVCCIGGAPIVRLPTAS